MVLVGSRKAAAAADAAPDALLDLAVCTPIHEPQTYGPRPAYSWCPACDTYSPAQIAAFRAQAQARGHFFGSRFCHVHGAELLARAALHRRSARPEAEQASVVQMALQAMPPGANQ